MLDKLKNRNLLIRVVENSELIFSLLMRAIKEKAVKNNKEYAEGKDATSGTITDIRNTLKSALEESETCILRMKPIETSRRAGTFHRMRCPAGVSVKCFGLTIDKNGIDRTSHTMIFCIKLETTNLKRYRMPEGIFLYCKG